MITFSYMSEITDSIYWQEHYIFRLYNVSIQTYYPANSLYVRHLKSLVDDSIFQSSLHMLLHERHWPVCLIEAIVRHSLPWTHWCCSRRLNGGYSLFSYLNLVFSRSRITSPSSPPHFRSFYLTISLCFLGRIQPVIIARQNGNILSPRQTHTNTHKLSISISLSLTNISKHKIFCKHHHYCGQCQSSRISSKATKWKGMSLLPCGPVIHLWNSL